MTKHSPVSMLCMTLCIAPNWPALGTTWAETPGPNILFIMSDDHAAHAIGAYGGRLAELNPTPTLDRLASEGTRLTNVFCGNSICVPSRATLMTGQYSHSNGITTLNGSLPPPRQTLAQEMKKAGYETAVIGKWHLGAEPAAFDYYGIRTRDFKLIFFYGLPLDGSGALQEPTARHWELYDLRQDPYEMNNVYADAEYARLAKRLQAELQQLKEHVGDPDDKYPQLLQRLRETK